MPIYEFYCTDCHTVFSFFSKSVNTAARPDCPRCGKRRLERQISMFSMGGSQDEAGETDDLPIDERKMEDAVSSLAAEAERIDENDPRQAAGLMRKFSSMTGLELGESMQNALSRMEDGEDPQAVEKEMGTMLDDEEPFILPGSKGSGGRSGGKQRVAPRRDETLYEL